MVDIETFKALHPSSSLARAFLRDDLGSAIVAGNDPLPDGFPLLLPPTVPGYNMLHKKWGTDPTYIFPRNLLLAVLTSSS